MIMRDSHDNSTEQLSMDPKQLSRLFPKHKMDTSPAAEGMTAPRKINHTLLSVVFLHQFPTCPKQSVLLLFLCLQRTFHRTRALFNTDPIDLILTVPPGNTHILLFFADDSVLYPLAVLGFELLRQTPSAAWRVARVAHHGLRGLWWASRSLRSAIVLWCRGCCSRLIRR